MYCGQSSRVCGFWRWRLCRGAGNVRHRVRLPGWRRGEAGQCRGRVGRAGPKGTDQLSRSTSLEDASDRGRQSWTPSIALTHVTERDERQPVSENRGFGSYPSRPSLSLDQSQFTTSRSSIRENSAVFAVTNVAPRVKACAAISMSLPPITVPFCSRCVRMVP
jgi:hypothetical protein